MRFPGICWTVSAVTLLAGAALSAPQAGRSQDRGAAFKLLVAEDGVYRVTYEDLVTAGLPPAPVASAGIGVSCRGLPVPIWIEDGGDGELGPGDWLELVGEHLGGDGTAFDHRFGLNVYRLDLGQPHPARMHQASPVERCRARDVAGCTYWKRVHLEKDLVRVSLSRQGEDRELWMWTALRFIDQTPFQTSVDLSDLEPDSDRRATLRVKLHGWSRIADRADSKLADHRLELLVNGSQLASAEWSTTRDGYLLEVDDLATSSLVAGENSLSLRVPRRLLGNGKDPVIDVVLLDWIELDYPRSPIVGEEPIDLELEEPASSLRLVGAGAETLVAYGPDGLRLELPLETFGGTADQQVDRSRPVHCAATSLAPGHYLVVPGGRLRRPFAIERDAPSHLAAVDQQADYVIVSHPRLLEAVEPLADFYRKRGLSVAVVDVTDIYDEFNHGVAHPGAIRAFLDHAFHRWRPPAPRFVLLVGDGSWDVRVGRGGADPGVSDLPAPDHRNLVPAWVRGEGLEYKADDSWLVSFDPDDGLPDMAIGRLPVTGPEEVAAIVDKTIRYVTQNHVGPWRRSILWLTGGGEAAGVADEVAPMLAARGAASVKLPDRDQQHADPRHRGLVLEALEQPHLVVDFAGHGSRGFLSTAPPDHLHGYDLVGIEDFERLTPRAGLPIVVASSCSSAPFDHPSADSIGEELLRLPGRGAVAVIAPSGQTLETNRELSFLLLDQLLSQPTVGEALLRAKRQTRREEFTHIYNLLGDPALPIPHPVLPVQLELVPASPPTVRVRIAAESFSGQARVEWVDTRGDPVLVDTLPARAGSFDAVCGADSQRLSDLTAVSVYVWSDEAAVDGVAGLVLPPRGASSLPRQTDQTDRPGRPVASSPQR